jgi:hypothetical protein
MWTEIELGTIAEGFKQRQKRTTFAPMNDTIALCPN